jgi:hypothetical protein
MFHLIIFYENLWLRANGFLNRKIVWKIALLITLVWFSPLPMYHSSSMWMAVGAAINVGCSVIVRKKFSATSYWSDCAR